MTFEIFTIICLIVTILIGPIYMWLLRSSKKTWTTSSHDTHGGSMTVVGEEVKVTWMDPIIKRIKK